MSTLTELRRRFSAALGSLVDDTSGLLDLIRPAQDARFGDYQANCAMPLGKRMGQSPRDVAAAIAERLDVHDMCHAPEIAGPGFINLRLKDEWLAAELARRVQDERLGISPAARARTYVIDYSSPNVAKPMHVGHIRSTVIGDALARTLRFLGHRTITDNHLGDWGTQFGMIIYGWKHFRDEAAFRQQPVTELSRLYKLVHQLVDYYETRRAVPDWERQLTEREAALADQRALLSATDKSLRKKADKAVRRLESQLQETRDELAAAQRKIQAVEATPVLAQLAAQHPGIAEAVLQETARLHAGDRENLALWHEFLPRCRQDIQRIYDRLDIRFDCEYGESFYHDQLAGVVEEFRRRGLAQDSDGASCVFLDGFDAPLIIRKRDGAFLYATTDLATIEYRVKTWNPDAILYVVDHRQSEHFVKLFAAARRWGCEHVELQHISFGTVMGEDGKPYKTRSGDTVGLEGLLDEAVSKAYGVVCANDDAKPGGPELSDAERRHVAHVVGHAAIKYADLAQNRTSDYVFSFDKMVALEGNTATYMQYSYARTQSIFAKGQVDLESLRRAADRLALEAPAERTLGLKLLQFAEALQDAVADYRPSQLTSYLFDLAKSFSEFYHQCPVLTAEKETLRTSRLLLCDLTGRTIRQGLDLLGIHVVDKM
ncbi:MAG: arginine--tRNA ligase [Candidatus Anammoximicrobium sp.]|nr:arginine--tRNA ligase [Candidatus Anammoximicrobium sp.]